jgi:multisubunit Na+/H+ antiporter MnhE subunit
MAEDSRRGPGRRVATWLAWWAAMMALWVMIDDSLRSDELLAGAGAAAIAALAAEIITDQGGVRLSARAGHDLALAALHLPGQVAQDTLVVFWALARGLATGRLPDGGFTELPVSSGDDTPAGETRRVLLTGVRSLAPNTFVVGIDADRDVMVVHRLVSREERRQSPGQEARR